MWILERQERNKLIRCLQNKKQKTNPKPNLDLQGRDCSVPPTRSWNNLCWCIMSSESLLPIFLHHSQFYRYKLKAISDLVRQGSYLCSQPAADLLTSRMHSNRICFHMTSVLFYQSSFSAVLNHCCNSILSEANWRCFPLESRQLSTISLWNGGHQAINDKNWSKKRADFQAMMINTSIAEL